MPLTVISAAYANPDHTAAVVQTQEAGAVLLSAVDTPVEWAAMLKHGAPTDFALPLPTLDDVKAECGRRILVAASLETQSNINGYVNSLNAVVTGGGALSDGQKADIALFVRAMGWIHDMREACAGLVGVADYTADSHWPALDADLLAFAERF